MNDDPGLLHAAAFGAALVVTAVLIVLLAGRPAQRWETARAYLFLFALAVAASAAAFLL